MSCVSTQPRTAAKPARAWPYRIVTAAALLAASLLAATPAISRAQALTLSFTPTANFVYQLDCVSGSRRTCAGREDFEALWRETLKIDPAQSPEVKRWGELRKAFAALSQSTARPDPEWGGEYFSVSNRVLTAGLAARDFEDLNSRLALLLPDALNSEAETIVNVLSPAFLRWWNEASRGDAAKTFERFSKTLSSPEIQGEVIAIQKLFGDPPPAKARARVHMMLRPEMVPAKGTSGENLGRESIAEFFADEHDDKRLDVIVHEYAHFVFASMKREDGVRLKRTIEDAAPDIAGPLWHLFNEAQATALGNGRISRRLMSAERYAAYLAKPNSFYAIGDIDAAAKALLPIVDRLIDENKSFFDPTFASAYATAVRAALGNRLAQPAMQIDHLQFVFDDRFPRDVVQSFVNASRASSVWSASIRCCGDDTAKAFESASRQPRVLLIRRDDWKKATFIPATLRSQLETALANSSATAGAVGVLFEAGSRPIVVFVTNDAAQLEPMVKSLMAEPTLTTRAWLIPAAP